MKNILFLTAAMLIAITASANEQAPAKRPNFYFGKVANLIYTALKEANVKPTCTDTNCSFVITNFESYEETDGCGGGTTGYGISFTYVDGKVQENKSCSNGNADFDGIVGASLAEIFGDLDLNRTSGWVSSIRVAKAECVTNRSQGQKVGGLANCQITSAAQ